MRAYSLIPAPIDEKNITSDWIEGIFDSTICVSGGGFYIGLVGGLPAFCKVIAHSVTWIIPRTPCFYTQEEMDSSLSTLNDRLSGFVYDCESSGRIRVKKDIITTLWCISMLFFFKEERDTNLF